MPGRLRLRTRVSPFYRALPTLRALAAITLGVCLTVGAIRFLSLPQRAGALEFTPHSVINSSAAKGILGSVITDIDGDGDNDIITAGLDGIKAYLNNGKYSFTKKDISSTRGERVQVADFDKDGAPDLLVSYPNTKPGVRWYRNNGSVSFSETTIDAGNNEKAGYAADLDADGDTDVATYTEDSSGTRGLRVWSNDGSGNFTALWSATNTGTTTITVGKIDDGSYPHLITGGEQGLQKWGTADGTTWNRSDIDDGNENRTFLVVVDMDGDDKNDVVAADQSENKLAIYKNTGSGNFDRYIVPEDTDATSIVATDLDNDDNVDLVVAGQDDNTVYWYDHSGALEFVRRTVVSNLTAVFNAAVGDLDKDNDLDIFAASHAQGRGFAYERIRVRPEATAPGELAQSTLGTGKISFQTTISDDDFDPTRIRVQYSLDGIVWEKPWLTKVTPHTGSVDLKNSNGYQVGTSNPIDTNAAAQVTLTLHWDTKSVQNTGGPLTSDPGSVQLRVLPRDNKEKGVHAISSKFRVDNRAPQGVTTLSLQSIGTDSVTLAWPAGKDTSNVVYDIYYGTDQTAVLEQRSSLWDSSKDEALAETSTTSTTITGLTKSTAYTFKLVAYDDFGNSAATAGIRGTTLATEPGPSPSTAVPASPTPTPAETPASTVIPSPSPSFTSPSPLPSVVPVPTPSPSRAPSVLIGNRVPQADAGPDLPVNPSALVVLDGSSSTDPDGDSLRFSWRQLAGPKVELLSSRTSAASFSADAESETYIFLLTVTDSKGAIATDQVTVATKSLPDTPQAPVAIVSTPPQATTPTAERPVPSLVKNVFHPINLILFILSLISTLLLLFERLYHAARQGTSPRNVVATVPGERQSAQGKVVHYSTGQPLAGVQVLVYGQDGKLRASERTNEQGAFPTFFPAGQYTLNVDAPGFSFASAASRSLAPEGGLLYTGGNLVVRDANKPLAIVIPMKPTAPEISSLKIRFLHLWQSTQHLGRVLSWPIFLVGALLNTVLVFIYPRPIYLVLEVTYVVLVILKIALEVRVRPAYGQVRDAITHVPLDLAVVRLFEQGTNRVVMTRVTNNQGKFFALPPAGKYTVTITKPGYGNFSKQDVEIKSEHDTTLQMIADLMPIAPHPSGLTQARAAVI